MENKKSTIIIISAAVIIAIVLGIGFATHWFTMGVEEHAEMTVNNTPYVV